MSWIVPPTNSYVEALNPRTLEWDYICRQRFKEIKMRLLRLALIHSDWCPYKECMHTETPVTLTHQGMTMWGPSAKGAAPPAKERGRRMNKVFHNCEKVNYSHLSHILWYFVTTVPADLHTIWSGKQIKYSFFLY